MRNPYDKIGHFFQGFVPALVAREILLREEHPERGPGLLRADHRSLSRHAGATLMRVPANARDKAEPVA